jgi:hypothetical protein
MNTTSLLRGFTVFAAVAALGAGTLLLSTTPSDAKSEKVRFRCHSETENVQLNTRYEERTNPKATRSSFRVQFEGSGDDFVTGTQLNVLVDSVSVGTITLMEEVAGEAEGQLRFDSRPHGRKVQSFPSNFPLVQAGSMVELQLAGATVIGCELQ